MYRKNIKVIPKKVSTSENFPMSTEQLRFYDENGYVIIRDLFEKNGMKKYRTYFAQLCDGTVKNNHVTFIKDRNLYKEGLKLEMYINKIQELLYDEVFVTFSEDPRLLAIVRQLIGDDVTAMNGMLINKPPGTMRHSPHQDLYFLPIRPASKIVGVWTASDPSTRSTGCLFVIPGSHRNELLYDHAEVPGEGKEFFFGIKEEEYVAPEHKQVYLEMEPGDTLFLHPYLVHGSGPNNSTNYRKSLTCHYANSGCHYVDVTGTCQEIIKTQFENSFKKRGGDFSFVDFWKIKSKPVFGPRSNL